MGRDERGAPALARALRDHLCWDETDLIGLPELARGDLAGLQAQAPIASGERGVTAESAAGASQAVSAERRGEPATPPEFMATRTPGSEAVGLGVGAAVPTGGADRGLALLEERVRACTRCELAKGRTQTVFARGNAASDLVFVGEGPGRDEDLQGAPFVGAAGKLLDRMIAAMKRSEREVYICNVVKCRPPQNRTPLPQETRACRPYLDDQLDAVAPKVIVALGRCAADNLGCVPPSGGRWRGRWGNYRGVPVMPTYHPAFLLRSPEFKRPVWEDLQQVMERLASL